MGFLKNLLKPSTKNFIKGQYDPAGAIRSAYKDSKAQPAPVAAAEPVDPMADVYGDPNDSGYGSFAQPFDVEQFYNYADPGYAFQLQQGTQALQNSAAAGSGALSGAALKDLLKYNQDYAGTAYNDAFNRYQTQQGNIFSRLASLLQLGQNAAAGVGSSGVNLAGNAGQAITNAGTAAGAGIVGAGNAVNQGLTNYWLMRQFMGGGGGGFGGLGGTSAASNTGIFNNVGYPAAIGV